MKKFALILLPLMLSACKATTPEAYDRDAKPEDRQEYNGAEGVRQYQRDKVYLMKKELSDKCDKVRIDFAVAKNDGDNKAMAEAKEEMSKTCV